MHFIFNFLRIDYEIFDLHSLSVLYFDIPFLKVLMNLPNLFVKNRMWHKVNF